MTDNQDREDVLASKEEQVAGISLGRRFLNFRTLLSFVLAIGLIVFVFERLDIDFGSILSEVWRSNHVYYALAFIAYYLTFPLRAWRWRVLLNNAAINEKHGVSLPSLWGLTQMIIINWFANSVLYARLGDAYRSYLLKQQSGASFSKTIGTVVAERVIDIIVVFLLLWGTIFGFLGSEGTVVAAAVAGAGTAMLALIAILILAFGRYGKSIERRLPAKIRSVFEPFRQGTIGSLNRLPTLITLSAAIWLLEATRLLLVSHALGIPIGFSLVLFAALANALLTTIPFTPGGLGLVEAGLTGLLTISLTRQEAMSIVLVDRSVSFLSVIVVGAAVFIWWHAKQSQRARQKGAAPAYRLEAVKEKKRKLLKASLDNEKS